MSSKFVILEKCAMDYSAKFSILSNELVRRCVTTSGQVPQERVDAIIDTYSEKLLRSGYNIAQTRQILISGLRGYQRKVQAAEEANQDLHRSAQSSLEARIKKKNV